MTHLVTNATENIDIYKLTYYHEVEDEQIIILNKLKPLVIVVKNIINTTCKLAKYLEDNYYHNVKLKLYTLKNYFKNNCYISISMDYGDLGYTYYKSIEGQSYHGSIISKADIIALAPVIMYNQDYFEYNNKDDDNDIVHIKYYPGGYHIQMIKGKTENKK